MEPNLEVKVLLVLAAALLLTAFAISWRGGTKFKHLRRWVEETHPGAWNALPWTLRQIGRRAAIERLRHDGLDKDPEFARLYDSFRAMNRWMIVFTIIGAVPLTLVILGTQFWGWAW